MTWQGERFLVVFNGGERRVTPRFHLFVSDADQLNDGAGWVQDDFAWPQILKEFSLTLHKLLKMVG